jgi:adenylate cyclase
MGETDKAAVPRYRRIERGTRFLTGLLTAAERRELRHAIVSSKLKGRAADLLSRFLLSEVVNGALNSLSLDELLRRLVELATQTAEAERGTIFLLDRERRELFSRVKRGDEVNEIRFPSVTGIAGAVLASGRPEIVSDVYRDARFNAAIDAITGYRTRSMIAVPLKKGDGRIIGVLEVLNKRKGKFDSADLLLVASIACQAAGALDHAKALEEERRERTLDLRLLNLAEALTADMDLDRVLTKIVEGAANLLDAERATLFVHDPAAGELFARVTTNNQVKEIRFCDDQGISGATLRTNRTISVADAYADPRFNQDIDGITGYVTRSLLSTPVHGVNGKPIAVMQVLNSRHDSFSAAEERRLRSFASQAGAALQNAQHFADVLALKSYTESLLRSLPDAVIKLDASLRIVGVNDSARKLLGLDLDQLPTNPADELWGPHNRWLIESLAYVARTGGTDYRPDVEFVIEAGVALSVNATTTPLRNTDGGLAGITIILQDLERQKKVHATVSRHMAKAFAERALSEEAACRTAWATMLFSDIRRFATLAETLTPQRTVELLNEYFAEMADVVHRHSGMLDKYIGDGVMAVFGIGPDPNADADAAVSAAIDMIRRLRKLNEKRLSQGAQPLEIGIGLASGEIVAGPVGGPTRTNYTVIGDSVNLAARLESANKHYRTTVLVAGPTIQRLKKLVRSRRIDLVRVQGKEEPTEIFELLEHHSPEIAAKFEALVASFEEGINRYRARQWRRALDCFAAALAVIPDDGPSWVYTDRCLYYRDHPPPDHWDGVWSLTGK